MEMNFRLEKGRQDVNQALYTYELRNGGILYLSLRTRPDIANAAGYLIQFNTCHDLSHWTAAK